MTTNNNTTATNNVANNNTATNVAPATTPKVVVTLNGEVDKEFNNLAIYHTDGKNIPSAVNAVVLTYSTTSATKGTIYHSLVIRHNGEVTSIGAARTLVRYFYASAKVAKDNTTTFTDEVGQTLKVYTINANGDKVEKELISRESNLLRPFLKATEITLSNGTDAVVIRNEKADFSKTLLAKGDFLVTAFEACKNAKTRKHLVHQLAQRWLDGLEKLTKIATAANKLS